MKIKAILLFLLMVLVGCAPQPELPLVTETQAVPPLPASTVVIETEDPAALLPTGPVSTPTLAPEQSYAAIAAVYANILSLESWLAEGLDAFERLAIVGNLVETSLAPLGEIYTRQTPVPELAAEWAEAQQIWEALYPQTQDWISGSVGDVDFGVFLSSTKDRSLAMMAQVNQIAEQAFGFSPDDFGEDYDAVLSVVYALQASMEEIPPDDLHPQCASGQPEVNPDLVVVQLTPFVFEVAGNRVFEVVGLVENSGSLPQVNVEIRVRFEDKEKRYLGTTFGTLSILAAPPGRPVPFRASAIVDGYQKNLVKWETYEVEITSCPSDTAGSSYYQDFNLAVSSAVQGMFGEYALTGTLTNTGDETIASNISIAVAAFDASGTIVGVGEGFVVPQAPLAPGESLPFEANLVASSAEPAYYEFIAQAAIGQ